MHTVLLGLQKQMQTFQCTLFGTNRSLYWQEMVQTLIFRHSGALLALVHTCLELYENVWNMLQNMCFWEVNDKRCQIQHVQCVMTSIQYGRKKCQKKWSKNTPVLQSMTRGVGINGIFFCVCVKYAAYMNVTPKYLGIIVPKHQSPRIRHDKTHKTMSKFNNTNIGAKPWRKHLLHASWIK